MKLSILKLQLMTFLVDEPFCKFQMSIHMIAISDLGETLQTWGLEVIFILLKIWVADMSGFDNSFQNIWVNRSVGVFNEIGDT